RCRAWRRSPRRSRGCGSRRESIRARGTRSSCPGRWWFSQRSAPSREGSGRGRPRLRQGASSRSERRPPRCPPRWRGGPASPREVFHGLAELGALGINYPEEVGGSGGDYWHVVVLAEELVRSRNSGVNMGILVQAQIATPIIEEIGTAEQKREFLAPALAGEK